MNPVVQKTYSIIAVVLACVFLYFVGIYISDNGNATNAIRAELESVRINQQNADAKLGRIEKGLTESVGRTEVITHTVETVAERNDRSKVGLIESERIITESKSILQDIRKTKQPNQK